MNVDVYQHVVDFITEENSGNFETLALEIFAHQYASIPAYRAVCERRGATPENVTDWRAIPPAPTLAFKHASLCAGAAERVFLTTGTTQGREARGRHAMPHLRLYEVAAVAGMKRFLFPDVASIRILSLIHGATERPESSLSQMIDWAFDRFAAPGSARFVTGESFDFDALASSLRDSEGDGEPVCLMATTAALSRFLDRCRDAGWSFRLAHSSRLMDTGGSKGAARVLSRNGLLRAVWDALAIPGYYVVNEYGMTEMSSQFYDNVIVDRYTGRFGHRAKVGPHWVRTRVLDPITLAEIAAGETGVLCHTDLANAGSALAVLTEDIGHIAKDGFEITGRIAGAEARGCSLALADYLA